MDEEHHSPGSAVSEMSNRLGSEARVRKHPAELIRRNLLSEEVDSFALILPCSRDKADTLLILSSRKAIQSELGVSVPGVSWIFAKK